jgi:outer membrane cobalamin receptor
VQGNLSVFLLVVFLFVMPSFVFSEESRDGDPSLATLDEVVVSATKTDEKRKDIANSVIIIDETDIKESAATSVGELLANEPGIDWRTQGDYGGAGQEIHIRGMDGKGTQVLVNGVTVNSPSLGTADVAGIPLNNIEKIEVVKGSGSLLYGTGAMGGTINIITKGPKKDTMDLKINAGYGTDDTYEISAEQGMFVIGDFGYYLTATKRDTDGFRDNGDLDHKDASAKLVYDKGDTINLSLYGDYIDRDYGIPGVKPPKGTDDYYVSGIKVFNSEAASLLDNGSDKDGHVVFNVKINPLEWLGFSLMGNFTNMENYIHSRYIDLYETGDLLGFEGTVINRIYATEGNVNINPLECLGILLGFEYKKYEWENESVDLDATGGRIHATKSNIEADLHTSGIYAEADYRPCRYFKTIIGIRHEDHSEFGTIDLPRLGLIFNLTDTTALKFNHGKQFRAPTPNDLFWPYQDYGFWSFGGNPDLKPEKGWHTDVSIDQSFLEDKVFITACYFHWSLKDKILWESDSNWHYGPLNLDTYKADGFEAGTKIGPFYNMSLSIDYTYTDAEEENEFVTRQATYTSKHLFKTDLTYWSNFGLMAKATARYTDKRKYYGGDKTTKDPVETLNPYWTLDFNLEQRLHQHWLFALYFNNLLDKNYDTYLASFTDPNTFVRSIAGYPGSGRSAFFKVIYEY